jgi:dipeptidase D
MSTSIFQLEPQAIWQNFYNLNQIPRASKKEENIRQFMIDFGHKLGLEVITDEVGNVLIKKPASTGMEARKTVVLQGHLDMVHQKNNDTQFDFDIQGIEMYIEGDWVKAKGTTLGADNGLGVAAIMGILSSSDIAHPALEALFTIDEETGMTGALGLKPGFLSGEILLNLDTEEDDELDIGCAGGIDVTAYKKYPEIPCPANHIGLEITVNGLKGGHSGMDIHKGLGNSNKIMNRILFALCPTVGVMLSAVDGGSLRNAIPRESKAILSLQPELLAQFETEFARIKNEILAEFKNLEPTLNIQYKACDAPPKAMDPIEEMKVLKSIYGAINGVYRMSPEMADLVEASNNVAKVTISDGSATVLCLTRSSVESTKMEVAYTLKSVFELGGFDCQFSGGYPGWKPEPNSSIVQLMTQRYEHLFGSSPAVIACHAGLECGIIGSHYPNMEMISFGPTIKGAHSPDERAKISSSVKFWNLLLDTLKHIPERVS